jgi:hypothetical protein
MAMAREQERDEMFKQHADGRINEYVHNRCVDASRCGLDLIPPLIANGLLARGAYSLLTIREPIRCNLDTFDTREFASLELVRSKFNVMKLYERSSSPISEDMLQSLLAKQQPQKLEEVPSESRNDDIQDGTRPTDSEEQKLAMIEDLIILLRERDLPELDKRLHQIETNPLLYSTIRSLLRKTMERFRLEPLLPRPLVATLNAD